jgi:hypothetical protein
MIRAFEVPHPNKCTVRIRAETYTVLTVAFLGFFQSLLQTVP